METPPVDLGKVVVDVNHPLHAKVTWNDQVIELHYWPLTRRARDEAMAAAVIAFRKQHEDMEGLDPGTYMRELAVRLIREWNVPMGVGEAWDRFPPELGDLIAKATGIEKVITDLTGRVRAERAKMKAPPVHPEVEKAKNSQGGAVENTTSPS